MIPQATLVDIGGLSETAQAEFAGPISAVRLANGVIVAAGWATTELRVFAPTGAWLRSSGAKGAGPGEFEALGYVYLADDGSLITYEPGARRIQAFDRSGVFQHLSVLATSPDEGSPTVVGSLPGHALLVQTSSAVDTAETAALIRNRHAYYRYNMSNGTFVRLFEAAGPTYIRHPFRPQFRIAVLPYSPSTLVAPFREGTVSSAGLGFGVEVRDANGQIRQRIRRSYREIPLRRTDRRVAATEATISMDPSLGVAVREIIVAAQVPRYRPAAATVVGTPEGRILVQHFGSPRAPGSQVSVFGPDGRWEQELTLPRPFLLTQAASDFMLGTYADSVGFYHIVLCLLPGGR